MKADVAAARGFAVEVAVVVEPSSPAIRASLLVSNRMRARLREVWAERGASDATAAAVLLVAAIVMVVEILVLVLVRFYL